MQTASIGVAVKEAITELTGRAAGPIADDDRLQDLGVDSMVGVSLLVAIEDRLGAMLPDGSEASLVGARTVGELVACLDDAFTSEAVHPTESAAPGGAR